MSAPDGTLRLHFCGSIPSENAYHSAICENVSSLAHAFLANGHSIVIRGVPEITEPKTLVDDIVFQAARKVAANGSWASDRLTVICEARHESHFGHDFEYLSIASPYTDRRDFYEDILSHCDVVIGIGGGRGLVRLVTLAEWVHVPVFALQGAGGEADELWADILHKIHQSQFYERNHKEMLRRLPPLNVAKKDYGQTTAPIFVSISRHLISRVREANTSRMDIQAVTIMEIMSASKRLTWGSWGAIGAILVLAAAFGAVLNKLGLFQ